MERGGKSDTVKLAKNKSAVLQLVNSQTGRRKAALKAASLSHGLQPTVLWGDKKPTQSWDVLTEHT